MSNLNSTLDEPDPRMSRRRFLTLMGWGVASCVGGMIGKGLIGLLDAHTTQKMASSLFSIGRPEEVLAKDGRIYLPEQKVFVEVSKGRVRCLNGTCASLCALNASENGFRCHNHNQIFDQDGKSLSSAKHLHFFQIYKGKSGELFVDKERHIHVSNEAWFTL